MKVKILTILFFIFLCLSSVGCGEKKQPAVLRVAIPYSDYVLDPNTNYYINYLEKETGLDIEPVTVMQTGGEEYLDALFAAGADIDVVFFGDKFMIDEETALRYAEAGKVYVSSNGTCYFPNYGAGSVGDCAQILWINYDWLNKLGLSIPTTVTEFEDILAAFKEGDPNGNGKKDEIPLIGSTDDYAYNPVELLLNSFVYNDPYNNRLFLSDVGKPESALKEPGFTEGIAYLNGLFKKGLINERNITLSLEEMTEIINANSDMVGAFTSDSISNVIYRMNPEILARYIHVAPLKSKRGANALYRDVPSRVGAVINANSKHIDEALLLMETMLKEDSSLIARYGEKGVDWEESDGLDVSIYGTISTIVTKNYLWDTPQNKHLNGIGPMMVDDKYLKGVTWNGVNSDAEYVDARSQVSYEPFLPKNHLEVEYDEKLGIYMRDRILSYILGKEDINNTEKWDFFVKSVEDGRKVQ